MNLGSLSCYSKPIVGTSKSISKFLILRVTQSYRSSSSGTHSQHTCVHTQKGKIEEKQVDFDSLFFMQQRDCRECNQYRIQPGWFWTDLLKGLQARHVARRTWFLVQF